MLVNIFYSWQSDLITKFNRSFIEECLKAAIKRVSKDNSYKIDYNLDRDTKGELGTVEIADTIFTKIKKAHIFIADISIINAEKKAVHRLTPNPNVLLELGFAASQIGWKNIILIYFSPQLIPDCQGNLGSLETKLSNQA